MTGSHNAENATAALAAAVAAGVDPALALEALGRFRGVKRRLELRGRYRDIALYDDFAHHPTAIARTIEGLRQQGSGRVLVVFEPRSNTMRMGVHQAELARAFAGADAVWIYQAGDLYLGSAGRVFGSGSGASRGRHHPHCRRRYVRGRARRPDRHHEQWRLRGHSREARGGFAAASLTAASRGIDCRL